MEGQNSTMPKPLEIANSEMFNLHEATEALPQQIKKNKAVLGRISHSSYPNGPRSNYKKGSNTEFEISIQNAQQMYVKSGCLCGDVVFTGAISNDTTTTFTGSHTMFNSFSMTLDGKKIVDLQQHADRVADFNLYTSSTRDQLDYTQSTLGVGVLVKNNDTLSFRIPIALFGCDITTVLPTGSINNTLRLNFKLNDNVLKQLYKGEGTETPIVTQVIEYNNLRFEADYVELQPLVLNKMIQLIQSNNGLTIPYHAYFVDNRSLGAPQSVLNQRITLSYNNVISIAQLPYAAVVADDNYYRKIKWGAAIKSNQISNYLINFEGSQYYNKNANAGESGTASLAQSLIDSTKSEETTAGHASAPVKDFDNYQVLSCSFVRSPSSLSPIIVDSGINARLYSSILTTSADFGANITSQLQLTSIVKFTRRIVFKNSQLDIMS